MFVFIMFLKTEKLEMDDLKLFIYKSCVEGKILIRNIQESLCGLIKELFIKIIKRYFLFLNKDYEHHNERVDETLVFGNFYSYIF